MLRGEMNSRFDTLNVRLDGIQRSMLQLAVVMSASMITGFIALAGLILAQH
jgi:hypothetical protein